MLNVSDIADVPPISTPCHEILVFDQANNESAVSYVVLSGISSIEQAVLTTYMYHGFCLTWWKNREN